MRLNPIAISSAYYILTKQLEKAIPIQQTNNISNCFFRFQSKPAPDIMLITDVDHSIIPWEKDKYKIAVNSKALSNNKIVLSDINDRLITALVTGLGWRSMQEISSHFDGFPVIDFLSCDNGKGDLFFNQKELLPFQWLKQIGLKDSNAEWQSYIKNKVGWDQSLVMSVFNQVLHKQGFKDINTVLPMTYPFYIIKQGLVQNNLVSIVLDPDESSLYIKKEEHLPTVFYEELTKDISSLIKDQLKQAGSNVDFMVS